MPFWPFEMFDGLGLEKYETVRTGCHPTNQSMGLHFFLLRVDLVYKEGNSFTRHIGQSWEAFVAVTKKGGGDEFCSSSNFSPFFRRLDTQDRGQRQHLATCLGVLLNHCLSAVLGRFAIDKCWSRQRKKKKQTGQQLQMHASRASSPATLRLRWSFQPPTTADCILRIACTKGYPIP